VVRVQDEETVFTIETDLTHCGAEDEAEERAEHRKYNTTQHNQMAALPTN
jgi:hypothetical protein